MTRIRKRNAAWLVIVALVCALCAPAHGDTLPWIEDGPQPHGPGGVVLLDHQPANFGGLASDTMVNEFPGWQRSADDFSLQ